MIRHTCGVLAAVVFLIGCAPRNAAEQETPEVRVTENGTRYLVHPDKILPGGPPPDGIPSIDDPIFVSVDEADQWLSDDELVMVLSRKGIEKAYPHQILVWHEIVNDFIAGDPVLITYCPLCGSGLAFDLEEQDLGVCAVSAPVLGPDGQLRAVLTLVAPAERFGLRERRKKAEAVGSAASKLGNQLDVRLNSD